MTTVDPVLEHRSAGRAVGSGRASLLVLEQMWTWYRRNWRATAFSSIGLPLLYLLAMGLGFGSQVRAGSVPDGLTYIAYLAPALLPTGAIQTAAGECTYPVLSSFAWSKIYYAITATPVAPAEVVAGLILWVGSRLLVSAAAFTVIAAALGAVTGPGILLSLVFGVLTGLAFGAPLIAFSSVVGNTGNAFTVIFRFVVVPMSLFSGTFFPITQLPAWVRPVAWLTPLWHGTELARGAELGTLTLWPTIGHIAFLLALFGIGTALACWRFRVRLYR